MPVVDINLNDVVEKPLLPDARYTLAVIKSELRQAKNPNKHTGQREWGVNCTLKPLNAPRDDYVVYKSWSLAPGSLESAEPEWSIKKFFELMKYQWSADGRFNSDDLLTFRFDADVKQTLNQETGRISPQIVKIYGPS
jgi:hypothetical protein